MTEKQLGQGRYNNTTNNTVYTATGVTAIIKSIRLCNTTGSAVTVRVFMVPSGGTADETTAIYYDYSIPANSTLSDDGFHVLLASGTVQFQNGTANGVTITLNGAEV